MDCMPGLPVHHQLLEFTQTHVHWVSDPIQPSHLLSSPFPPAFNLSQHQGVFYWVGSSHQVAKVLELQLEHQSFQWISELISFMIDWLDLLAVQGTLKSLLQHHSSKASILRCSAFFMYLLLFLIYSNWRLITLQYRSGFAIHWHESAMGVHVFPILSPTPTSLGFHTFQTLAVLSFPDTARVEE